MKEENSKQKLENNLESYDNLRKNDSVLKTI